MFLTTSLHLVNSNITRSLANYKFRKVGLTLQRVYAVVIGELGEAPSLSNN